MLKRKKLVDNIASLELKQQRGEVLEKNQLEKIRRKQGAMSEYCKQTVKVDTFLAAVCAGELDALRQAEGKLKEVCAASSRRK